MDGASGLFCGSKVGKAQHAHENGSMKTREIAYFGVHGW
jgi:hypothetical protein